MTGAQWSYLHTLASETEKRRRRSAPEPRRPDASRSCRRKPGGRTEGAESGWARALGPGA
ncbi:MAG: hypothetical protein ACREOQ_03655 [Gemmatimonadales bacterium]